MRSRPLLPTLAEATGMIGVTLRNRPIMLPICGGSGYPSTAPACARLTQAGNKLLIHAVVFERRAEIKDGAAEVHADLEFDATDMEDDPVLNLRPGF